MKSSFKSFMTPSSSEIEDAWKYENTIFIFDTNVLLNLYGFEEQTREDFFSIAVSLGDKVWIPFHVGLEYNKQRLTVIGKEKKTFRTLNNTTESLITKLKSDLADLRLKDKFPKIQELSEKLVVDITTTIEQFNTAIDPWDKNQPDVRSQDRVLDKIHEITNNRIGPAPKDQTWLDAIYKEGEHRYENKIPPGFKDSTKDQSNKIPPSFTHNKLVYNRKFGDLIIWKQVLEQAELTSVKNVFFITDDLKEDWWTTVDSGGSKTIGPHEELKREIYNIQTVDFFHMYTTSDFLGNGRQILNVDIQESSISDATTKFETWTEKENGIPAKEIKIIIDSISKEIFESTRQNTACYEKETQHLELRTPLEIANYVSLKKLAKTLAEREGTMNLSAADTLLDQLNLSQQLAELKSIEIANHNHNHNQIAERYKRYLQDLKTRDSDEKQ